MSPRLVPPGRMAHINETRAKTLKEPLLETGENQNYAQPISDLVNDKDDNENLSKSGRKSEMNSPYEKRMVELTHLSEVMDPNDTIIVTTIGLVIHSIADGLALGASLFCKDILITLIFFFQ